MNLRPSGYEPDELPGCSIPRQTVGSERKNGSRDGSGSAKRGGLNQHAIICPTGRPGGDLLSRALRRSTIGSGGLNDRVRNGIGWGPSDIATRSIEWMIEDSVIAQSSFSARRRSRRHAWARLRNDQADRAISTGKLHASQRFHTRPINVVVYYGSQRDLVLRLVSRLDAFSGYLFRT